MTIEERDLLQRLAGGEIIGAATIPYEMLMSLFDRRLIWHVKVIKSTGKLQPFTDEEVSYYVEITDTGRAAISGGHRSTP